MTWLFTVMRMEYPSADVRAACPVPMLPPAPAMFST